MRSAECAHGLTMADCEEDVAVLPTAEDMPDSGAAETPPGPRARGRRGLVENMRWRDQEPDTMSGIKTFSRTDA